MELGSVTLKRIGFFCFPIKHSTHSVVSPSAAADSPALSNRAAAGVSQRFPFPVPAFDRHGRLTGAEGFATMSITVQYNSVQLT
jgi:hypothetical protein